MFWHLSSMYRRNLGEWGTLRYAAWSDNNTVRYTTPLHTVARICICHARFATLAPYDLGLINYFF